MQRPTTPKADRVHRALAVLVLGLLLPSCGIDAVLLNEATKRGHVEVPPPQDSVVIVQTDPGIFDRATSCPGTTTLSVLGPDGGEEPAASVAPRPGVDHTFDVRLPGTDSFHNLHVVARRGGVVGLALVPEVPRQDSVLAPEKVYQYGEPSPPAYALGAPEMAPLGVRSTAITLALDYKLDLLGLSPAALPRATTLQAVADLAVLLETSDLLRLTGQILACGESLCNGPEPFGFGHPADEGGGAQTVALSSEFIAAAQASCEGLDGLSGEVFDAARAAVAEQLTLEFAYDESRIRVVFMVDLNSGLDRNCSPTDPWRWAVDEPGRTVYFTGGVQASTPICGDGRSEHCLNAEQRGAINEALGANPESGWQPNVVRMYDDGSHGDTLAGDRVYTITFDLPYWSPAEARDGAGLRLSYKYTYGKAKQSWTSTEEWPGNSRILELDDLNADHLIIRFDLFGDETTNKDKGNMLLPSNGGCGRVLFPAEQAEAYEDYGECVMDAVENRIDSDGDCTLDTWPVAPRVMPIIL